MFVWDLRVMNSISGKRRMLLGLLLTWCGVGNAAPLRCRI